ncbi:hypothetical protein KSH72_027040, partial [Escherichia coli]|nr:hypothetical protein [Escherichia coli]
WMSLLPFPLCCLWEWYQHPCPRRFTRTPLYLTRLPHLFASLSPALAPVLAYCSPSPLFPVGQRPSRRVSLPLSLLHIFPFPPS